jgi:hypothetical protein
MWRSLHLHATGFPRLPIGTISVYWIQRGKLLWRTRVRLGGSLAPFLFDACYLFRSHAATIYLFVNDRT